MTKSVHKNEFENQQRVEPAKASNEESQKAKRAPLYENFLPKLKNAIFQSFHIVEASFKDFLALYRIKKFKFQSYSIISFILLFVFVLFQNTSSFQIQLLFWQLNVSKIGVFFTLLIIGSVFGYWLKYYNSSRQLNLDSSTKIKSEDDLKSSTFHKESIDHKEL